MSDNLLPQHDLDERNGLGRERENVPIAARELAEIQHVVIAAIRRPFVPECYLRPILDSVIEALVGYSNRW